MFYLGLFYVAPPQVYYGGVDYRMEPAVGLILVQQSDAGHKQLAPTEASR